MIPGLPLLLRFLGDTGAEIDIIDLYSFWNCSPRYEYFTLLECGWDSVEIKSILRCITELNSSSYILENMMLSFASDENNRAIIPSLPTDKLSVIHLKAGTDVSEIETAYV